jgi:hypothetical protein
MLKVEVRNMATHTMMHNVEKVFVSFLPCSQMITLHLMDEDGDKLNIFFDSFAELNRMLETAKSEAFEAEREAQVAAITEGMESDTREV